MFKHLKHSFHFILILAMFVATIVAYSHFSKTVYFVELQVWAQANFFRFFLILVFVKALGIVWPPLPGVVLLIGSIPIIEWLPAFLADAIGWYIGATISFLLSRRYGMRTIRFFFGESGVERVKNFKVNANRELEVLTIMKIMGGSIGEFINYAAGLTTISFLNFCLSNVIASLVIGLPLFYAFHFALGSSNLFFAFVPLALGIGFFYIFRKRYFIWNDSLTKENPEQKTTA